MKIRSKGQVTIPAALRERAGLMPETEVEFEFDGGAVRIRPAAQAKMGGRGTRLISVMRGRGDIAMTTEQIMALTRGE